MGKARLTYKVYLANGDLLMGAMDWALALWVMFELMARDEETKGWSLRAGTQVLWRHGRDGTDPTAKDAVMLVQARVDALAEHAKLRAQGKRPSKAVLVEQASKEAAASTPNPQPMVKAAPKADAKPRMSKAAAKKATVLEGK